MPQVRNESVVDGYYRNCATDAGDKPRAWSAATINFQPGQVRFVPASMRQQSRSVNDAFSAALASGSLQGPAANAEGPWDGVVKSSPPPAPVEDPPEEEVVEEDPPVEEESEPTNPGLDPDATNPEGDPEEDSVQKSSKRRRRRKSSDD